MSKTPSTIDTKPEMQSRGSNLSPYLLEMRLHQWLKNALLLLPIISGHAFNLATLSVGLIAVGSFSLGASSIYIINDIIDRPHDRTHPEKRHRPIAADIIGIPQAVVLFCILAGGAIALASLLPKEFILAIAGYAALALSYSVYFKRKLMIDVVLLAALYGVRVLAGGAATGIVLSNWLLVFCFFIFLSLALMKRTTEIMLLPEKGAEKIKGRGYRRADLPIINSLTTASGFVAVLVLALYINSPEVKLLYSKPDLLWGICIVLVYWLGRIFFLTGRGEMRQDPVIFAAIDGISLLSGLCVAIIFLLAV